MSVEKNMVFSGRGEWRKWLSENHLSEKELRVVFFRKQGNESRLTHEEAIEEALCFGWVDSIIKRIDDISYSYKFTPRKTGSKWSELNIKRYNKMVKEGRMTKAGIEKRGTVEASVPPSKKYPALSEELLNELKKNETAYKNFNALSLSEKSKYCGWIQSAVKQETKLKRLTEAISLLEKNQKLGLK